MKEQPSTPTTQDKQSSFKEKRTKSRVLIEQAALYRRMSGGKAQQEVKTADEVKEQKEEEKEIEV